MRCLERPSLASPESTCSRLSCCSFAALSDVGALFAGAAFLLAGLVAGAWKIGTGTTPFFTLAEAVLSFGAGASATAALFFFAVFAGELALAALAGFAFASLVDADEVDDGFSLLFFAATFFKTRLRAGAAMLCSFHVLPR